MTFSQCLSQARKTRGMSQEALAHQVGVSRQAVSKWETGEALPDLPRLLAVADALELPLDDLCGRDLPPSPPHRLLPERLPNQTPLLRPIFPSPHRPLVRIPALPPLPPGSGCGASSPWSLPFFLGAGLTGGAVWGICQSQLVPSEEAAAADLPEAFTVSGLSFSSQNDILSYTFTPSTAAPGTTYQISFTDSQGHTEIFDPSCSGGVCSGTAALDPLESYQVTVTAQTGTAQRSLAVAGNLTFGKSRADWMPLEEMP